MSKREAPSPQKRAATASIATAQQQQPQQQQQLFSPSMQKRRTPASNAQPEPSPTTGAALALSILCQQRHKPPPAAPASVPTYAPVRTTMGYPPPYDHHHAYAHYQPDQMSSSSSPYMPAKRLKVAQEAPSPMYHPAPLPPPLPRYAPSPYHPPHPSQSWEQQGPPQRYRYAKPPHSYQYSPYVPPARPSAPLPPNVTPTPKKQQTAYSRKNKSLGLLCENFIQLYSGKKEDVEVSIDDAAKTMGVERRRIYDIVNILEALEIVERKCKNTYTWKGTQVLPYVFIKLQQEGLQNFSEDAKKHGLLLKEHDFSQEDYIPSKLGQKKSLGRLAQHFCQLFLVGHKVMSLTEASDLILGVSSLEQLAAISKAPANALENPTTLQAAATKGLKTKIRRLYDIANVFTSLALIKKMDSKKSKPVFVWSYKHSAQQILNFKTKGATTSCVKESVKTASAADPKQESPALLSANKQSIPSEDKLTESPSLSSDCDKQPALTTPMVDTAAAKQAPESSPASQEQSMDAPKLPSGKVNSLPTASAKQAMAPDTAAVKQAPKSSTDAQMDTTSGYNTAAVEQATTKSSTTAQVQSMNTTPAVSKTLDTAVVTDLKATAAEQSAETTPDINKTLGTAVVTDPAKTSTIAAAAPKQLMETTPGKPATMDPSATPMLDNNKLMANIHATGAEFEPKKPPVEELSLLCRTVSISPSDEQQDVTTVSSL